MGLGDIERTLAGLGRQGGVARFDGGEPPVEDALAVLPSAFNPPTLAHLELLREGAAALDAVPAALLTTNNVDKGIYGAPLAHRVGMLLAAGADLEMAVLATDAARFADQARRLREAMPRTRIDFIAGYDTLVRLFEPRYYESEAALGNALDEFFALHRLVAANRGDADVEEVAAFLATEAARPYAHRVLAVEVSPEAAAMSSTEARITADREGVPPTVAAYIRQHGLY